MIVYRKLKNQSDTAALVAKSLSIVGHQIHTRMILVRILNTTIFQGKIWFLNFVDTYVVERFS